MGFSADRQRKKADVLDGCSCWCDRRSATGLPFTAHAMLFFPVVLQRTASRALLEHGASFIRSDKPMSIGKMPYGHLGNMIRIHPCDIRVSFPSRWCGNQRLTDICSKGQSNAPKTPRHIPADSDGLGICDIPGHDGQSRSLNTGTTPGSVHSCTDWMASTPITKYASRNFP